VSSDSPPAFGNLQAYRDDIVPWLCELADAVHEHDAAIMMQITHLGRRTNWNKADWLPVLAPSPIREPAHRAFPKAVEDWDIDRIVSDYADAAERMQAGGLDGIELEAYGHLMDQFWSPATNHRTDAFGGSLDNRMRFSLRVIEAVRKRVGPDFIVGVRMAADEDWQQGLSREEGIEIARRLVATGHIDFLNLIRGHIETDAALRKVIPIHGMPSAPHLDFCGEVRAATNFPVFHAARINDVATARHAVAEGKLDLVGMTRAHIADPHIINKIAEGREHQIRPCVGATYCLDRIYEGHEALCIHNPATGREATMPHIIAPAAAPGVRVIVVGAGPAGLEAARIAAARGHTVHLLEASDKPGGQVRLLSRVSRRREMIGLIDWRIAECERAGVTFNFNVYAGVDEISALAPDIVIIATGGVPNTDVLAYGSDLCVSTWDILSGDVKPGQRVLIYDDNAAHAGLTAAEMVALSGAELEIVTPERFFAADIGGLNHAAYAEILADHGVDITINARIVGASRKGNQILVQVGSDYSDRRQERLVDQLIVEHGTLPNDELYFALKPQSRNFGAVDYGALRDGRKQDITRNPEGDFQLFRIGDAVASRNIHAAIYDALRLVKDL
ncbi:MAG: FAD-dependent oxidoreductase, partial [Hyphomicrobiaceae bacterium]